MGASKGCTSCFVPSHKGDYTKQILLFINFYICIVRENIKKDKKYIKVLIFKAFKKKYCKPLL